MARQLHRLTALTVSKAKPGHTLGDGGNLYLQVNQSGGKYWIYRYRTHAGKDVVCSIGPARLIPLIDARQKASALSVLRLQGKDPRAEKKAAKVQATFVQPTFQALAMAYIEANRTEWKNAKHAGQWATTLERYAYPSMGSIPADKVDRAIVLKALQPIWTKIPATADRVRQRIEAILDYAAGLGYRTEANPARWKTSLKAVLPRKFKNRPVRHFPSLPYEATPDFMRKLRANDCLSSFALQYLILTATRTSETLLAQWDEIDFTNKTWTIPGSRTKTEKDHTVPLPPQALAILDRVPRVENNPYIFAGSKKGQPLSNMALLKLRNRLELQSITIHGFRSTFRNWAAENGYPREIAEMALSHAVKDKVEAAYLRTRMVKKRRPMMEAWGQYCG